MDLNQAEDDFFLEGYDDFFHGSDYNECPWSEGTDGECGWKKGWKKAEKEQELADTLAPIIPNEPMIAKWKAHPLKPDVIIGTWAEDSNEYEIICPVQLRNAIIAMQNRLE